MKKFSITTLFILLSFNLHSAELTKLCGSFEKRVKWMAGYQYEKVTGQYSQGINLLGDYDTKVDSFKLKLKGKFPQPSFILGMNIYLQTIHPIIGLVSISSVLCLALFYPVIFLFSLLLLFERFRILFLYYILSEVALLLSILQYIRGEKKIVWKKWRS